MDMKELKDLPDDTELLIRVRLFAKQEHSIRVMMDGYPLTVYPSCVDCVAPPRPEPIKVGDIVVSKLGGHLLYEVLGIHNEFVWLKVVRGINAPFEEDVCTHYLKDYRKADINEPHFRYP